MMAMDSYFFTQGNESLPEQSKLPSHPLPIS
jgi:hypothetical protein